MSGIVWIHRTMIAHHSVADTCRQLAVGFAGSGSAEMWTVPVYTQAGELHGYISAGRIDSTLAAAVDSDQGLADMSGMTLEQAQGILSVCVVSESEDVDGILAANGLTLENME